MIEIVYLHAYQMSSWILIAIILQGERSSDNTEDIEKTDAPSLSLYHEELEGEDYLFRTNLDGM